MKMQPLGLGLMALVGGTAAIQIPSLVGRIAVWASIAGAVSYVHLTTVRRLLVDDDGVDVDLPRRRGCIRYQHLDHVTVRAMRTGIYLRLVMKAPPTVIGGRIGLASGEVPRVAPRLIRALRIQGVEVRVLGGSDAGAG